MQLLSAEAVDLIRSFRAFLEEESPSACLASPEDADYFRTVARRQKAEGTAEKKAPPQTNLEFKASPALGPAPKTAEPTAEPAKPLLPKIQTEVQANVPPLSEPKSAQRDGSATAPAASPIEKTALKTKEHPLAEGLSPSRSPSAFTLADVRKVFVQAFPQFPLIDEIPSDAIAIKIAERWKTKNKTAPISILSLHEPPEQRALLEQIAKAIDATLFPARVVNAETIEKEKQWEAFLSAPGLKAAIACDYTLWQLNHLMTFYKENPTQGTRTLGTVPLFLLPDLSLYLKDPLLKRSLWKALCQKLSS